MKFNENITDRVALGLLPAIMVLTVLLTLKTCERSMLQLEQQITPCPDVEVLQWEQFGRIQSAAICMNEFALSTPIPRCN